MPCTVPVGGVLVDVFSFATLAISSTPFLLYKQLRATIVLCR